MFLTLEHVEVPIEYHTSPKSKEFESLWKGEIALEGEWLVLGVLLFAE